MIDIDRQQVFNVAIIQLHLVDILISDVPSLFCSLCLEWNSVGLLETSFSVFCEGLSSNCTLHTLDLRNNQITHEGGIELAHALKRNTTLRILGRFIECG